jgi:pyruvate/2-oxoglutarate dehydrogenase complex dihydrolipoamide acyltransferase (E2) component
MSSSAAEPTPLRLNESLFENSMTQEAILLSWLASPGAWVEPGQRVAEVMVEDMRHEIIAPVSGRLVDPVPASTVLEPGDQLCRLAPSASA